MQLREHYNKNSKYFWIYTIAVFAIAVLAVGVLGSVGASGPGSGKAAATPDPNAPVLTAASVTPAAHPLPAASVVQPAANPPLGQGIVPGSKDDTEGTRAPSR